jgi:hypothetical protein
VVVDGVTLTVLPRLIPVPPLVATVVPTVAVVPPVLPAAAVTVVVVPLVAAAADTWLLGAVRLTPPVVLLSRAVVMVMVDEVAALTAGVVEESVVWIEAVLDDAVVTATDGDVAALSAVVETDVAGALTEAVVFAPPLAAGVSTCVPADTWGELGTDADAVSCVEVVEEAAVWTVAVSCVVVTVATLVEACVAAVAAVSAVVVAPPAVDAVVLVVSAAAAVIGAVVVAAAAVVVVAAAVVLMAASVTGLPAVLTDGEDVESPESAQAAPTLVENTPATPSRRATDTVATGRITQDSAS